MTGYDYGNARLRAMRGRLLDMGDYTALLSAGSLDGLLGVLHATPYEVDVEAAMTRDRSLRAIDDAVRRNLARTFRAMRSFYDDEAGRRVELLVKRWDVRNLRTILRARSRLAPPDSVVAELVPAGDLSDAELMELAEQPNVRGVVELMVAWELPDRWVARRVLQQLPIFDATGEVSHLERTLFQAWGETLAERLTDLPGDRGMSLILRAEIDHSNVVAAARYWDARLGNETVPLLLLDELTPGGRIAGRTIHAASQYADRSEVARALAEGPSLPGWKVALVAWAEHGDTTQLAEELARDLFHAAGRLFTTDPLDSSVPTAFTFAKEAEAQNIRLIARGVVHGFPPDEIAEHLVVAA